MPRAPDLTGALVRKGEAGPVSPDAAIAPPMPRQEAPQSLPLAMEPQEIQPAVARPQRPAAKLAPPVEPPGEEPRQAVTTRLKLSTKERLRDLVYRRRWKIQDIIDNALEEYIDRNLPPEA